jgi:predicted DNA-binding ArsR family transcriptional regulator
MVSDKDFEDYQNLIQQRLEAMEAQILSLTDTVEKQAALINQLVDGTPTHSVTIINIKGDKAKGTALSEINPINKEDLK